MPTPDHRTETDYIPAWLPLSDEWSHIGPNGQSLRDKDYQYLDGGSGSHSSETPGIHISACMSAEDAAFIKRACNEYADLKAQNEALRGALESIARAPAFDANSQSLVDLAQRTLKRIQQ